jgi:hypothetical protein
MIYKPLTSMMIRVDHGPAGMTFGTGLDLGHIGGVNINESIL